MIKLNGAIIEKNSFPDGTLLMKADTETRINTIEWRYESDAELFAVYCLKRHLDQTVFFEVEVDLFAMTDQNEIVIRIFLNGQSQSFNHHTGSVISSHCIYGDLHFVTCLRLFV